MSSPYGLSVREASRLYGYHPEHIRRLVRQGAIRARKIGLMLFINKGSIDDYVERVRGTPDRRSVPN